MKKLAVLLALAGCGPLAADVTIGWGANQRIKKTLEMDQKQTDAQTQSQESIWSDLIDIIPIFASSTPTPAPTPTPPKVKAVIVELAETPTPVPTPELIIRRAPKAAEHTGKPCKN